MSWRWQSNPRLGKRNERLDGARVGQLRLQRRVRAKRPERQHDRPPRTGRQALVVELPGERLQRPARLRAWRGRRAVGWRAPFSTRGPNRAWRLGQHVHCGRELERAGVDCLDERLAQLQVHHTHQHLGDELERTRVDDGLWRAAGWKWQRLSWGADVAAISLGRGSPAAMPPAGRRHWTRDWQSRWRRGCVRACCPTVADP